MADDNFPPLRAPSACVACNKKKVRCMFPDGSRPCLSCRRNNWNCVPRERRRRRQRLVSGHSPHRVGNGRGPSSYNELSNPDIPGWQPEASPKNHPVGLGLRTESTAATSDLLGIIDPIASPADVLGPIPETGQPTGDQEAYVSVHQNVPTGSSLSSRARYMKSDHLTAEIQANVVSPMEGEGPSANDIGILRAQHVFDLPSKAVRDSMIETFTERCLPWMPVVERSWLVESDTEKQSILLLQAVFLAACRLSSAPTVIAYASPLELYRRAKTLFYSGYEKDPMILVAVTCILQWYNPAGPEHVSLNTSTMWRYIGVGLAHQIGLHKEPPPGRDASKRRRLWWSLYARDCLISSAHGRPLAINIEDCDVREPSAEDFCFSSSNADLFIAYVEICSLLGQVTQCCCRQSLSRSVRMDIKTRLLRWIGNLPPLLRLFQTSSPVPPTYAGQRTVACPYSFEARQLHVPYFVILAILFQQSSPGSSPSTVSVLSSSAVVWIFEDFLARDEIRFLSSTFVFYLVVAARSLLSCYGHPSWLDLGAKRDTQTIELALKELGKHWASATRRSEELQTIAEEIDTPQRGERLPALGTLSPHEWSFFSSFAPSISWAWDRVVGDIAALKPNQPHPGSSNGRAAPTYPVTMTPGILAELVTPIPSPGVVDAHGVFPAMAETRSSANPAHGDHGGAGDWILKDWDWSLSCDN